MEANPLNYQFSSWNDTDQTAAIVEGSLGSFSGELPAAAMEQYSGLGDWTEYISMVSHVRTVCPLEELAARMRTDLAFPAVSFYTSAEARLGDEGLETGNVADGGMDVGAVLGLLGDQSSRFQDSLQRKFLSFVKGHLGKLSKGVMVFGQGSRMARRESLERCGFWRDTVDTVVPAYGKRF